MNPGREMDALVAEKVFGYLRFAPSVLHLLKHHIIEDYVDNQPCIMCGRRDDTEECLPHYSTDISAAWEIVDRLKDNFIFTIRIGGKGKPGSTYTMDTYVTITGKGISEMAVCATAPHAICEAALKAVGVEVNCD